MNRLIEDPLVGQLAADIIGNKQIMNRLVAMIRDVPAHLAAGTAMAIISQVAAVAEQSGKTANKVYTAAELITAACLIVEGVSVLPVPSTIVDDLAGEP